MHDPVLFALGLHAHQPVGNFDHVLEDHLRDVYEPFLTKAAEGALDTPPMFASLILISIFGLSLFGFIQLLGKLLMPWQESGK